MCLPFGISSAPCKFTKLLKPIISWLCLQCIVLVIYIDDIWITALTYCACYDSMLMTAHCLSTHGFLLNHKKSHLCSSQEVTALGYVLNSRTMTISLPAKKEMDVLEHCNKLYKAQITTIRYVARVLGKLIACFPVLPLGRSHYQFIEHDKITALQNHRFNFDTRMSLSWPAKKELLWWITHLPAAVCPIDRCPVSILLFVDASSYGWGSYLPPLFAQGFFNDLEYVQSINTKETLAIYYSILSFLPYLHNQHVLIRSDNTTAVSYISKMGGMMDF